MFDPTDGSLSLRRCEISLRSYEQNLSVPSGVPGIGGTSISLPSRPSFGRVSAPLPAPETSARNRSSGVAQSQDKPTEMVGHESEVATWNLRRGRDWPVVKTPVRVEGHVSETSSSTSAPKYGLTFVPQVIPNVFFYKLAIVCGTTNQFPFPTGPSTVTLSFPSILFPLPRR